MAAALWAVLIPDQWSDRGLQVVGMPMELVLATTPEASDARLALVDQFKAQGAQGLLAPRVCSRAATGLVLCARGAPGA